MLLVFDSAAAALYKFARAWGNALGRLCTDPARLVLLLCASAVAYIPLALAFTPFEWLDIGPFAFQLSRPLHYAIYFFAGVGVGALPTVAVAVFPEARPAIVRIGAFVERRLYGCHFFRVKRNFAALRAFSQRRWE